MKNFVIRAVHFGTKVCNNQRNAQVFYLNYLFTYALHVSSFFRPSSDAFVQFWPWFKYNLSSGADTIPIIIEQAPKLYT
jgi:hypothetical protein